MRKTKLLLIDNFHSFSFNLFQLYTTLGARVTVVKNNEVDASNFEDFGVDGVIISPGPGHPCDKMLFGNCLEILRAQSSLAFLGVCLGHQGIAVAFGGMVVRAQKAVHGKTSEIHHKGSGLFANVPTPLAGVRYHSLVVAAQSLPKCLEVTANCDNPNNTIMALAHKRRDVFGVQFHPESYATQYGKTIALNFLEGVENGFY